LEGDEMRDPVAMLKNAKKMGGWGNVRSKKSTGAKGIDMHVMRLSKE